MDDSKINGAISRVKNCLDYSLKKKYDIQNPETTQKLLLSHGMAKENFDFIKNVEKIFSNNIADVSLDANANKNETTISGIMNEATIPVNKVVGYRSLYRKIKEMYGKTEAKRLMGEMFDYSLALADSSKITLPYCFSIDASKIVIEGRNFGMLPSGPSHRLSSYFSALNETVHQLSNHIAGALAIGSLFFDVAHILLYHEKYTIEDLKNTTVRKYIENCFQNFVHSVNHLSRNAVESPFTNISVFDRQKLKTFLTPDNMGWYFDEDFGVNESDKEEYIIQYIGELQSIFMDFFDKGDPMNGGRNYRFPVVTLNISKEIDNGSIRIMDEEFVKKISKHEIYRYNILVSEGSKVASCCFDGETKFVTTEGMKSFNEFFVGEEIAVPTHTGEIKKAVVKTYGTQSLNRVTFQNKLGYLNSMHSVKVTSNHEWILSDGSITNNLQVGDVIAKTPEFDIYGVEVFADSEWEVSNIEKDVCKELVWCLEVEDNHSFILEGGIVTRNCRLLNNFELLEMGGQMNSFGGAGISLGSHRVVTINFNRIALEATSFENYKEILNERIESSSKILEAHRMLIKDLIDAGYQPFMKRGWLRLERMFSTLGVIGIVEAQETLKSKFNVSEDVIEVSLKFLNEKAKELTINTGNIYNIEQIPGESMAPKLAMVDKMLFGESNVPYELYSNQFVPLWADANIYERMMVDGKYNQLFTGGGIVHFNLGERVSEEQAKSLIKYAAEVGCEHFALNPVYSECESGHNSFGKHEECPVCGKKIVNYYTRVVGFFVPVSSFNTTRRNWEFPKRLFTKI